MNAAFLLVTTAWIAGADASPPRPAGPAAAAAVYSVGTGGCAGGGCSSGGAVTAAATRCGCGGESEGFFSKLKGRFHHASCGLRLWLREREALRPRKRPRLLRPAAAATPAAAAAAPATPAAATPAAACARSSRACSTAAAASVAVTPAAAAATPAAVAAAAVAAGVSGGVLTPIPGGTMPKEPIGLPKEEPKKLPSGDKVNPEKSTPDKTDSEEAGQRAADPATGRGPRAGHRPDHRQEPVLSPADEGPPSP